MSLISSGSGFLFDVQCSHSAFGTAWLSGSESCSSRVSISFFHLYGFPCVGAYSTYSKIKVAH